MTDSGNLRKYKSKHPLKRILIQKFQQTLVAVLKNSVPGIETDESFTLCDVGCGEGIIDRFLLDTYSNLKVTGYDLSESAVSYAQTLNPEASFHVKNIFDEDISVQYDLVICSEVLEHLHDPVKAFHLLTRMTRTALIVTVPHEPYFCLGNLLSLKNVTHLGNPEDHLQHWTARAFRNWVREQTEHATIFYSFPWQGAVISQT